MVDWDRVEELRAKGWDWEHITEDPKVGFHPDTSVHDPGRALRGLYHRQRSREGRTGKEPSSSRPSKKSGDPTKPIWNLPRIGYLLAPSIGVWFLLAYAAPSPVGVLVPAIPWLAIGLAVAAFILLFGLLRSSGKRWTPLFRTTLITGVVIGLVVAGLVGVTGYLAFGCPYLPPASTLTGLPAGWAKVSVSPWHQDGKPVIYFYGASWCPYCSAGSWTIYKALSEFGSVSGASSSLGYSSLGDVSPGTPEVIIGSSNFAYSSSTISLIVIEDTSGVQETFPGTSTCYETAYNGAYSGGAIPFVVINGQYIHATTPIINPSDLASFNYASVQSGSSGGSPAVLSQVNGESGTAWSVVDSQAWWMMAFLTKATGDSVSSLASQYHWSSATQSAVTGYLGQIG